MISSYPQLLKNIKSTIGKPVKTDLLYKLTNPNTSYCDEYIRDCHQHDPMESLESQGCWNIEESANWNVAHDMDVLIVGRIEGLVIGGFKTSSSMAGVFVYDYEKPVVQNAVPNHQVTLSGTVIKFADHLTLQRADRGRANLGYEFVQGQAFVKKQKGRNGRHFGTRISNSEFDLVDQEQPSVMLKKGRQPIKAFGTVNYIFGKQYARGGGTLETILSMGRFPAGGKCCGPKTSLKQEVLQYKPPMAPAVRILLVGSVGSGKSSYFNTINSVFKGHVTSRAHCGSTQHSVTKKFRIYQVRHEQQASNTSPNFQLCDTMGLENDESVGLQTVDFAFLLDGHVPDNFQFNPLVRIGPKSPGFIPSPTIGERMHVICYVTDACSLEMLSEGHHSIERFKSLEQTAIERDLPIIVLLTKIDKLCPLVAGDVSLVYQSKAVHQAVERTSVLTGMPRSHVLPVKNYEHELELDQAIDILALGALRQIFRYADDYFDNM